MSQNLSYPFDEIQKAKTQVESYSPGKQAYLVDIASLEWLKRAISMAKREEWLTQTNYWNAFGPETPESKKELSDAFEALKAAAVKKIPLYQPQAKFFTNKDATEMALMREKVYGIDNAKKIHNIGIQQSSWLIAKDDYGLPTSRYKQGYIWAYIGEDHWAHPYCVLVNVNIIQDYAGGGTYGESYGNFIKSEVCGCPK